MTSNDQNMNHHDHEPPNQRHTTTTLDRFQTRIQKFLSIYRSTTTASRSEKHAQHSAAQHSTSHYYIFVCFFFYFFSLSSIFACWYLNTHFFAFGIVHIVSFFPTSCVLPRKIHPSPPKNSRSNCCSRTPKRTTTFFFIIISSSSSSSSSPFHFCVHRSYLLHILLPYLHLFISLIKVLGIYLLSKLSKRVSIFDCFLIGLFLETPLIFFGPLPINLGSLTTSYLFFFLFGTLSFVFPKY